ncbi:MAG: hypothetical protein KJ687_06265 [Proteobacteria bacterium]|nr:hypothetical protein [Pseudomonadota bacterium]
MKATMTPAYRQYLLKERGVTQKAIVLELGVAEMSVPKEINDGYDSHRIRCAIAEKIGLPVDVVFTDYYNHPPQRKTSKFAVAL